jgi:hypothetical protein
MAEREADPAPPRLVIAASVGLLLVMVGGATAAGQLASAASKKQDSPPPAPSDGRGTAYLAPPPPRVPTAHVVGNGGCPEGCPIPQTVCIDSACRLAPAARWQLTPLRTLTDGASPVTTSRVCLRFKDQPQVCFQGRPGGKEGHLVAYDVVSAPSFVVRSEDLEVGAVELEVDGDHGKAPQSRFVGSSKMFELGLMLRVRKDGTGVRFQITPAP